jgi:hypothetical protein
MVKKFRVNYFIVLKLIGQDKTIYSITLLPAFVSCSSDNPTPDQPIQ